MINEPSSSTSSDRTYEELKPVLDHMSLPATMLKF